MLVKPIDCVLGLKAMEGAEQLFVSAWVVGGEFFGIELGVGDVAPPASRDADFGKELPCFLQNDDLSMGRFFCANDSRENACSASADDDNSFFVLWVHFLSFLQEAGFQYDRISTFAAFDLFLIVSETDVLV